MVLTLLLVFAAIYLISISAPASQKVTIFCFVGFSLLSLAAILSMIKPNSMHNKIGKSNKLLLGSNPFIREEFKNHNNMVKPLEDYHKFIDQKHRNSYIIVCAFMIVAFIIISVGVIEGKDYVFYAGAITEIAGMIIMYLINKTIDHDYHKELMRLQKLFMQRQLIEETSDENKKDEMRIALFEQLRVN